MTEKYEQSAERKRVTTGQESLRRYFSGQEPVDEDTVTPAPPITDQKSLESSAVVTPPWINARTHEG